MLHPVLKICASSKGDGTSSALAPASSYRSSSPKPHIYTRMRFLLYTNRWPRQWSPLLTLLLPPDWSPELS